MGGHGPVLKPTKYHSIQDIPDEMVKTYSKRDPNNPIYKTRRWVDWKKKQILYSQNDGIPPYLRTPIKRAFYYGAWTSTWLLFAYNMYCIKKYYLK